MSIDRLIITPSNCPLVQRLRQRRSQSASASYPPLPPQRTRSQMTYHAGQYGYDEAEEEDYPYPPYYSLESEYGHYARDRRSRAGNVSQRPPLLHDFSVQSGDWNRNTSTEGYLSDTNLAQRQHRTASGQGRHSARGQERARRPRSAAALRNGGLWYIP